jgi:hypothetical protein
MKKRASKQQAPRLVTVDKLVAVVGGKLVPDKSENNADTIK